MEALARHLLTPILAEPEGLQLQAIEGDDVTILEAIVADADRDTLESDDGRTLRAVRTVLSAAAGRRKATLEVVDAFSDGEE